MKHTLIGRHVRLRNEVNPLKDEDRHVVYEVVGDDGTRLTLKPVAEYTMLFDKEEVLIPKSFLEMVDF